TPFRSDVRVANPLATRQTVTLIFTRSGEDGRTSFSAIEAVLEPGQTLAFDDVLESAFHTSGTGSLEILGDVIVMSRTYAVKADGTMGQQIPPNLDTTGLGERQLDVAALPLGDYRLNAGIVETAGGSGTIVVGMRRMQILPYSHVQFPFAVEDAPRATILSAAVVEGDARIAAYLSQVDNQTNDAMFIPAMQRRQGAYTVMAPAVRTRGANGTDWRSDVWLYSFELGIVVRLRAIEEGRSVQRDFLAAGVTVLEDVLAHQYLDGSMSVAALVLELPYSFSAMSRIRTDGMSQFVPFLDPAGPAEQQLVFIESANGYRTNIGIVAEEAAMAQVVIYDAAGAEVSRTTLSTSGGVAQTAVLTPVIGGRATVRFTAGRGRAYASLVDNSTGDATYVAGQ
ncbi:MAG TPA: hypothetical protein VE010_16965, partial [Thermoanaerobaculia bacterium]|nr:hypothetical protein [Thermoanaerobaculia bacterium]